MSERKEKELEVRFVGEDENLRKSIRNALVHGVVRSLTWSKFPDFALRTSNSLVVIECKDFLRQGKTKTTSWLNQLASISPLMFFSSMASIEQQLLTYLIHLFEEAGATVFVGESGKRALLEFLSRMSQRDPANVITSLKITDNGLTVVFADDRIANVSFSELKQLVETDEILLNEIRIAGDRTYITVGTKHGESIPIPHDVLREYVESEKANRRKDVRRQRAVTAKNLGSHIHKLREQAQLSQEKLAEKMGKSRWTVIRIENGEYLPKVSDLQNLAKALDIEIGELLEMKQVDG